MTHHIVRTAEELEALDPDTCLIAQTGTKVTAGTYFAAVKGRRFRFPVAVLATGEQVRAARKALEEA